METINEFLQFTIFQISSYKLTISEVVIITLIFSVTKLVLWLISKYLKRRVSHGKLDSGKQYAVHQIIVYIAYIIAIILSLDAVGIKITVLLAGSTAILVGLGLGLQDLFKDMVAGFVLLFERAVTSGDIIEIDGIVGQVKEVGFRTTSLLTREDIVLIVPNTKLTNNNIINWSQNKSLTRFAVSIGVAYGSDTAEVEKLLIQATKDNPDIATKPEPKVYFSNFGESSLDFTLYFFSKNLFRIERTKSELRFKIDEVFRENNVRIPFPQRDLWIKEYPKSKE